MHDGIEDLKAAIARLEAAVHFHLETAVREQQRMAALNAEVETLRMMQRTLASRLDSAIARLKSSLDG